MNKVEVYTQDCALYIGRFLTITKALLISLVRINLSSPPNTIVWFSFLGTWFYRNHYLFLSLSHSKELQLVATKSWSLSQLHQITGGIRAGTENEDYRRERVGLLEYRLKTNHGRGHVLLAHSSCHEIRDGEVNPVHTEATQEKKSLEVCQLLFVTAGEGGRFWRVVIAPLKKKRISTTIKPTRPKDEK